MKRFATKVEIVDDLVKVFFRVEPTMPITPVPEELLRRDWIGTVSVPKSSIHISGDGTKPDFTKAEIRDHGQTVAFGDYEADIDWFFKEYQLSTPMGYGQGLQGQVYACETTGPPLLVHETDDYKKNTHITFELKDYLKQAAREAFGVEEVPIFRFSLHAADARWLCIHLIHALTKVEDESGVAHKIEKAMLEILDLKE